LVNPHDLAVIAHEAHLSDGLKRIKPLVEFAHPGDLFLKI
jgi:hypothetical protein